MRDPLVASVHAAVARTVSLAEHDLALRRLGSTYDVITADPRNNPDCPGERFFRLAFRCLDSFSTKRSHQQKRFHDAIFQTLAPHIYKDDFLFKRDQLLDEFGRESFAFASLILTPRRWGKTTATAMAIAVALYVCRGVNVLCFSTGQEMSTTLMEKVKKFFMELPDAADRVLSSTVRRFIVSHIDEPTGSSKKTVLQAGRYNGLLARAATVQGNKGVTADITEYSVKTDYSESVDFGHFQEICVLVTMFPQKRSKLKSWI